MVALIREMVISSSEGFCAELITSPKKMRHDLGPHMVCTRCGIIGADARPNWREHRAQGAG
jgi:hypothetical protein